MNQSQDYYPYITPALDNQKRNPIPQKIKNGIAFVIILFVVACVGVYLLTPKTQNLEDQEPIIDYAGASSRVAGIQVLMNYGLTKEQYDQTYKELTTIFDKANPTAKLFDVVSDSIALESSENEQDTSMTDEEESAILEKLSASGDHTDIIYGEEEPDEEVTEDGEEVGNIISFKMKTDKNEEYTVKIDPDKNLKNVSVRVYDSNGNLIGDNDE